jgi:predicted SPOUT superfamily RNA methylase MTH1
MKKLLFILAFMLSVLAVNGQADTTHSKMKTMQMTTVKVSDLPKAITDNIAKDYPGYAVKDASSGMMNGALNYKVVVTKGTSSESLIYDKDGKFLKKLAKK